MVPGTWDQLQHVHALAEELAGKIMVTQAVVPLQIEPQASRCTPAQEVTIQKDGISISMHGVSSDTVDRPLLHPAQYTDHTPVPLPSVSG